MHIVNISVHSFTYIYVELARVELLDAFTSYHEENV